jgi:hypothetical protein
MMPWRDQCGTDGRQTGRSSDAVEVERGVGTGIEWAGGSKVAAANIAFIWRTPVKRDKGRCAAMWRLINSGCQIFLFITVAV